MERSFWKANRCKEGALKVVHVIVLLFSESFDRLMLEHMKCRSFIGQSLQNVISIAKSSNARSGLFIEFFGFDWCTIDMIMNYTISENENVGFATETMKIENWTSNGNVGFSGFLSWISLTAKSCASDLRRTRINSKNSQSVRWNHDLSSDFSLLRSLQSFRAWTRRNFRMHPPKFALESGWAIWRFWKLLARSLRAPNDFSIPNTFWRIHHKCHRILRCVWWIALKTASKQLQKQTVSIRIESNRIEWWMQW
jgi:hypothetical protein